MTVLNSDFKDSNTEEVKKYLKNPITYDKEQYFNFELNKTSAPEFTFFDNKKIRAGRYDFKIDNVNFVNCWIEPCCKEEGKPIKYRSGSYFVYTSLK